MTEWGGSLYNIANDRGNCYLTLGSSGIMEGMAVYQAQKKWYA